MHDPDTQVLALWEAGIQAPPAWRPARLLAVERAGADPRRVEREPIGVRDAALFRLRERLFGPQLDCVTDCPRCRVPLEFVVNVDMLRVDSSATSTTELVVSEEGVTARCRLPNTLDLAQVDPTTLPEEQERWLLDRCVLAVEISGQPAGTDHLPPSIVPRINAALAAADPQADVQLQMQCPDCGAQWDAGFDIGAFLWSEIQARASRLLREIHELAGAYGWSEPQILSLSPLRRRAYLEMVRA
ncbi:MAG: hypothetical protein IT581_02330 [Verrucomicrobiales bacterium]|nr:hypothetical protein [Verrucomicrobiales bacterium]